MNQFDKDFNLFSKLIMGWWAFVAILSCLSLSGLVYVVWKVLLYFGVLP